VWKKSPRVDGTKITLPVSKGDHHFGVCAVDKDGHRSLGAHPQPWRG
jgi:hypothetical protein